MGLPFLAVAARSLPLVDGGTTTEPKADRGGDRPETTAGRLVGVLCHPPAGRRSTRAGPPTPPGSSWHSRGKWGPTRRSRQRAALAKADAWLDAAKPADLQQDQALKVILGVHSARPRRDDPPAIDALLALQRADGGWSQTVPELKSDRLCHGPDVCTPWRSPAIRPSGPKSGAGIDFLVATQAADGSWPMVSRSTPDGSPGSAKLLTPITCAASSWATLGLARLAPKSTAERDARKIRPRSPARTAGGALAELRGAGAPGLPHQADRPNRPAEALGVGTSRLAGDQ